MQTILLDQRKRSAGLLLLSGKRVLLLRRSRSVRNPNTWGLPGGQRIHSEPGYATALREATEEIGWAPPHRLVGAIAVQRGDRRYEIFAARSARRLRERWRPRLDAEHSDWRWVPWSWMETHQRELHPVMACLLAADQGAAWLRALVRDSTAPGTTTGGRRREDRIALLA